MYQPEPYRIKMVEPIRLLSRAEREQKIIAAGYNPFSLRSEDVFIDLLTDSGTGAMSDRQWAGLMMGDESYAGSRSYYHLESTVQDVFAHTFAIPTHQGRGAEQVLFPLLITSPNQLVIGNIHFDTTQAHIDLSGGRGLNLVIEEALDTSLDHPFKGNIDLERLEKVLRDTTREEIAFILMTVTCNSAGGQPVSMENLRAVAQLAAKYNVPYFLDAARFAENAYFIQKREAGYANVPIADIVREMFSFVDGFTMSAKKDGLVNIGGLIGIREDAELALKVRGRVVPLEGFPTYGGLAGRDMEALAVGLKEVLDLDYLDHRIRQVALLGQLLDEAGVPIQKPVGGHAVFVDAKKFVPHIPVEQFPAHVLAVELYKEAGVRGVEVGSLMMGRDPVTKEQIPSPFEFLRLTIPRRVYTDNHMRHVAAGVIAVYERREQLQGLEFEYEPEVLRHFMAKFRPIGS